MRVGWLPAECCRDVGCSSAICQSSRWCLNTESCTIVPQAVRFCGIHFRFVETACLKGAFCGFFLSIGCARNCPALSASSLFFSGAQTRRFLSPFTLGAPHMRDHRPSKLTSILLAVHWLMWLFWFLTSVISLFTPPHQIKISITTLFAGCADRLRGERQGNLGHDGPCRGEQEAAVRGHRGRRRCGFQALLPPFEAHARLATTS